MERINIEHEEAEIRGKINRSDSNRLQLELDGSRNVIIRRDLGVECLGSTPTRFRHICLVGWELRKNEAAKGGIKGNASGFCEVVGGTSDNRIQRCLNCP